MALLEYVLGNTYYSIWALHNFVSVQNKVRKPFPVPYDFDVTGLVNPPYAIPARGLMLKAVTDRMYRGPCRRQELVDPYVANFIAKKDLVKALPDLIPGLDRRSRDDVKLFINSFYSSIDSSKDVKGLFVNCSPKSTM